MVTGICLTTATQDEVKEISFRAFLRVQLHAVSIVAFLFFVLGLALMVFIGEIGEGLKALFAAYLISPYGIPMLAAWLIGKVDGLNERLKAI